MLIGGETITSLPGQVHCVRDAAGVQMPSRGGGHRCIGFFVAAGMGISGLAYGLESLGDHYTY